MTDQRIVRQRDSARAWAVELEQQVAAYSTLVRQLARRASAQRRQAQRWRCTWLMASNDQRWLDDDTNFARTADAAGTEPGAPT